MLLLLIEVFDNFNDNIIQFITQYKIAFFADVRILMNEDKSFR
jgi:hypothetical protein